MRNLHSYLTLLAIVLVAGLLAPLAPANAGVVGAVYTMSNDPAGNAVLQFDRFQDGSLAYSDSYATGGLGTGGGLGNQRGLTLTSNRKWLLVVNAGSDEISVFQVKKHGLTLTDTEASGGVRPVSIASHQNLVYVLHAGGSVGDVDSIAGFVLDKRGRLHLIPGSERFLSAVSTGPAQIGFTPDGDVIAVTEKATNIIDTYVLNADESSDMLADGPIVHSSVGMTPFGFSFGNRDQLFVSEAFGAQPDAGAVTSYQVRSDGGLDVIDPSVPNTETAPCWLVVTRDGRNAYTTNTPSDSLSAFEIDFDGYLTLLDADGRTGEPGPGTRPIDMDFSADERFLYTLNGGNGTIGAFRVLPDQGLDLIQSVAGVPAGANGLAAR